MGNTRSKLFMILAVASLFFLGAAHVTNATTYDTFSATSVSASGGNLGGAEVSVNVWYYGALAGDNPWGITIPSCGGCNEDPFNSGNSSLLNASPTTGTSAYGATDNAIFDSSTPGFELVGGVLNGIYVTAGATCPGGGLDTPCGALNTGSSTSLVVGEGLYDFYVSGQLFAGDACNGNSETPFGPDNSTNPCTNTGTPVKVTYVGGTVVDGVTMPVGTFTATDTSISYVFEIVGSSTTPPPTPEPSSLLMLGSGLLGLFGMGLRRKIEA